MKFTKLYEDVKASDLFKPASPEEVAERQAIYPDVMLKEALDSAKKTKLPDGTWHVHRDLDISYCGLTSLQNLNVSITDGNIDCDHNNLTTLEGAPTTVNGHFYCSFNNLTDLEGAPTTVNRNFVCLYNPRKFTRDDVRAVCDVKGKIKT